MIRMARTSHEKEPENPGPNKVRCFVLKACQPKLVVAAAAKHDHDDHDDPNHLATFITKETHVFTSFIGHHMPVI